MDTDNINIVNDLDFNLFRDITINNFKDTFSFVKDEKISEYGISPMCLYAPYDNIKYAVYKNFLISFYFENDTMFIGISGNCFSPQFKEVLTELYNKIGYLNLKYLSSSKRKIIKDIFKDYSIKEKTDENQYDYVYEIKDFIKTEGRANRHKREHYNYFINNFNYTYEKMNINNVSDCMSITEEWCKRKDCSECEYCCEKDIISVLINNWNEYPMEGGLLYIDGRPAAFLMAEPLFDTLMGYHQKTVSSDIKGLGYAIYIEALKSSFSHLKYFNIGPDIGIPGLRQFKRNFKPYTLVEKWELNISD